MLRLFMFGGKRPPVFPRVWYIPEPGTLTAGVAVLAEPPVAIDEASLGIMEPGTTGVVGLKLRFDDWISYDGHWNTSGDPPVEDGFWGVGEMYTLSLPGTLAKAYYVFGYWNTHEDGTGDSVYPGGEYALIGPVTFYAQWLGTITCNYVGNGHTEGDPPVDPNTYLAGVEVTVLGPGTLEKDGYRWMSWNSQSGGGGYSYAPDDTFNIQRLWYLYAQWEKVYTVTYDANGGIGPPVDGADYIEDEEVTVLSAGGMTRAGHTFTGWNTSADGAGDTYNPTDTFNMPPEDMTLYARWEVLSRGGRKWTAHGFDPFDPLYDEEAGILDNEIFT